MAIDINAVNFLLLAHKDGVQFENVLTLGRLNLNVYAKTLIARLRENQIAPKEVLALEQERPDSMFAEPLFKDLGAKSVVALDASSYQGASLIHDLNKPIPSSLADSFDLVYDGGSLEHVFNFPIAIQNCMEMLRVGGHVIAHSVVNNCAGHGFYQFSPELYYRAFSAENGFRVRRMILHVVGPYGRWYEVADPATVKARVELINFAPAMLLVLATKLEKRAIFETVPQQSDFHDQWEGADKAQDLGSRGQRIAARVSKRLPRLGRLLHVASVGLHFYNTFSLRNRRFFKPLPKP